MNRKDTGNLGERKAFDFLKKKGYRILEKNYRCRRGEIDIVAQKKDVIVFVEVRTKRSSSFGIPEESVTAVKMEKLVTAALTYLAEHQKENASWRIDFVAVELDGSDKVRRIEIIENAVL